MASTEVEIGGVQQWPTRETFAEARQALNAAFNALESLTYGFRALDGGYDPADIALESVPVSSETIAATVEFLTESEIEVGELARFQKEIERWPGIMANVRLDQRAQGRSDDAS